MYAKVFASLWTGTLYGRSDDQLVFIFLLAHADPEGFVEAVPQAIAGATGLEVGRVRAALLNLEAADESSRTPDQDGRRLERLDAHRDWGWKIVNYQLYREMRDPETVRAQTRERVRRHRERNAPKPSVTLGNAPKRQAEAEAEVDAKNQHPSSPQAATDTGNGSAKGETNGNGQLTVKEWFLQCFWPYYPRKVGKRAAYNRIKVLFRAAGPELENELGNAIMDALDHFKRGEWSTREPDKVPHAATFLNREDFLDAG